MNREMKEAELNQREQANIRDNETRLLIANITSMEDGIEDVDPI